MSSPYEQMWRELGRDLAAHDQLLTVLGEAYGQIFLTQPHRPKGMAYFDFVISEVHGLRIKELLDGQKNGRRIIGSFCVFVPEEIVRGAEANLVGLCTGADFAIEEVERHLPRNTCALIKSALGFKLGRVCPFIESADMIVGENTCDGKKKFYEILAQMVPNLYVMDLPQVKSAQGKELLRTEYQRFKQAVEELCGVSIDAGRLKKGIQIVNDKRRAIHRLNGLRRADPAPISGLDALLINQVYFYDDPIRFSQAVHRLCDELEGRIEREEGVAPKGALRLLFSGCPMAVPNWKLPWIVESAGAVVVGEESCVGERGTRNLVADESQRVDELMAAVLDRYFQVDCAIFTPNPDRLTHVRQMFDDYRAGGVIHYSLQFCQPYQIESLPLEEALEKARLPTLRVETDYSQEDVEQLKTRVEAFLEMLK